MKPLSHTGDSANIAYYSEPTREFGDIWAEVLRAGFYWTGSGKRRVMHTRRHPNFWIRVYRIGVGEVAYRKYTPRTDVAAGPLDDRTVTRLVRAMLKGAS